MQNGSISYEVLIKAEAEASNNRNIRDKELKHNCEEYRKSIYHLLQNIDSNETLIANHIRNWAKDLEELFMLHDQAWAINTIANVIIKSMKTAGIPDSKFTYVHKALAVYKGKYIRNIDHSSIQSKEQSSNQQEHFIYKSKAKEYYDALAILANFEPTEVLREDAQNIAEKAITTKERIIEINEMYKIATCEPTSDDFEGIEDKFQEKVEYRQTIPAKTELSEQMIGWGEDLIEVGKIIENEGIIDPETNQQMLSEYEIKMMAESIKLERFLLKPTQDRKWRSDWLGWMEIVQDAVEWFKHSASTNNKRRSFKGFYRTLTREQIGARKEPALKLAKKIYQLTPWKLYFSGIWWRKVRVPSGADFSIRLAPKLSDRSIK